MSPELLKEKSMPIVAVEVKYPGLDAQSVDINEIVWRPSLHQSALLTSEMLPSRIDFPPSDKIAAYNQEVLHDKVKYGHTGDLSVVAAFLRLLEPKNPAQYSHAVIDLCSGIGTLTTPIAVKFSKVLALEVNQHFVGKYRAYLGHKPGSEVRHVTCKRADLSDVYGTLKTARGWLKRRGIRPEELHAVVMNPPYMRPALIPHSFLFATQLNPSMIVAVMPLDILWELSGGYSPRIHHDPQDPEKRKADSRYLQAQSDAVFVKGLRDTLGWKLDKLIPHYRPDGTTGYGTMLFRRPRRHSCPVHGAPCPLDPQRARPLRH
jgi:hypothetical protein